MCFLTLFYEIGHSRSYHCSSMTKMKVDDAMEMQVMRKAVLRVMRNKVIKNTKTMNSMKVMKVMTGVKVMKNMKIKKRE